MTDQQPAVLEAFGLVCSERDTYRERCVRMEAEIRRLDAQLQATSQCRQDPYFSGGCPCDCHVRD